MTDSQKLLELFQKDSLEFKTLDSLFLYIENNLQIPQDRAKEFISKLEKSGKIYMYKPQKYTLLPNERLGLYFAKFCGNIRGFGFCNCKGLDFDIFISADKTNGAIDGDMVVCKVYSKTAESGEGVVESIVDPVDKMVGTVQEIASNLFFVPKDARIAGNFVLKTDKKYPNGTLLVCDLDRKTLGKVFAYPCEEIGQEDDIKALELALIREHNIYEVFPDEVVAEANAISQTVPQKLIDGRVDLRDQIIFTIDGEDAKDLDDAISIEKFDGGYNVGVHIADVGQYVKYGTALDDEAFKRGTSTYFPTSVLPMLPKALSNGICSLNEGVDRLTLSCIMKVDDFGKVTDYKIVESVIKSTARLTYTEVFEALHGKLNDKTKNLVDKFVLMRSLCDVLEKNTKQRGALDLDIPETEFVFDEDGMAIDLKKRERNEAHRLIEDFMVLANETVARFACEKGLPFVFRVHEAPLKDKVMGVCEFLKELGEPYPKVPEKVRSTYYQDLLKLVKDKTYAETVNKVILRSMQKAVYRPQNLGHFGLALDFYCHFTSPIRRYPDLCIHRILKEYFKKEMSKNRKAELDEFVLDASLNSSEREKNADSAERDVDDLWKAYLLKDRIGQEFEGVISSVTPHGFYVALENSVEGMVKLESLPPDNYLFMEKRQALKSSRLTFAIGAKVLVKLVASNLWTRHIDFEFVRFLK